MTVEYQSNGDIFGEEFQDEYYDELKYEVLSRSPEENVEVALEYMSINWHRHGDESRVQVEMILTLLLDLAKQVPATYKIEERVVKRVALGPTLDLDKFQEGYKRISGELFTTQEQKDDISNFISALEKLPHVTIEGSVLGGVTRQDVRNVFDPIFGEHVNGEDLAFDLRKHLERSFI